MIWRRLLQPPAPSIRQLTWVSVVLLATVIGVVVAALLWNSSAFHTATESIVRDSRSEAIAAELAVSLLMYQRVSNLYVITRDPGTAADREALSARLSRLLDEARTQTSDAHERNLVAKIATGIERYGEERRRQEEAGLPLEEIVATTRPRLGAVLDRVETLRAVNEAQVAEVYRRSLHVDRLAILLGIGACAVLLASWLAIAVGARRYLVRPLLALHGTMARFADGETESRGARGGVREVAELSGMFDDMAASLARQRQDQLAFLAGVAHDLKNPLGALKLGIQALERDRSESRRAKTRRRLERQVDFLARMVEDLLDATRIEAGQLEIRLEQLDVRDLVTDMAALYRGTAPERPIEVRVPETAVLVSGDPLRLEQVVSNLFSNALKFSPRGSPMWAEVAARNGEVVVEVTDRGMGIPPDEIDDVFKPFRRRMPDTAPGAGLGLSVVRRIVEAHGGAIEVESEPGAGSTFRVRLPRRPGTVGE